jgi:hypothetical protein
MVLNIPRTFSPSLPCTYPHYTIFFSYHSPFFISPLCSPCLLHHPAQVIGPSFCPCFTLTLPVGLEWEKCFGNLPGSASATLAYAILYKIVCFNPYRNIPWGHAVAILVEAIWYKPKGRGFDSRWGDWILWIYLILPAALWLCGRLSL